MHVLIYCIALQDTCTIHMETHGTADFCWIDCSGFFLHRETSSFEGFSNLIKFTKEIKQPINPATVMATDHVIPQFLLCFDSSWSQAAASIPLERAFEILKELEGKSDTAPGTLLEGLNCCCISEGGFRWKNTNLQPGNQFEWKVAKGIVSIVSQIWASALAASHMLSC